MRHTVTVGVDGSPASLAAAEWAADEAVRRGVPLRLLHAAAPAPGLIAPADPVPDPDDLDWSPYAMADALRAARPEAEVGVEQVVGQPLPVLFAGAQDTELLVLGSRGAGPAAGFLLGSVPLTVAGQSPVPVVLVRAAPNAGGTASPDSGGLASPGPGGAAPHVGAASPDSAHAASPDSGAGPGRSRDPYEPSTGASRDDGQEAGGVVLGLDLDRPGERLVAFAFDAAARRGATLRVVYGRSTAAPHDPGADGRDSGGRPPQDGDALARVLAPWREKYPDTRVVGESATDDPDRRLLAASARAALLVIGRRPRGTRLSAHLGSTSHAVLHHALVPVAVVPHD